MVKAYLQLAQRVRMLVAAVMITFRMKAGNAEVVKMVKALQDYASDAKAKGKDHDMGPPHLYLWLALIEALIERGDQVGQKNLATLKQYDEVLADISMDDLADQVPYVRLSKMYKKEFKRLEFHVTDGKVKKLVQDSLTSIGAVRLHGAAPPTGLEVLMQEVLEAE